MPGNKKARLWRNLTGRATLTLYNERRGKVREALDVLQDTIGELHDLQVAQAVNFQHEFNELDDLLLGIDGEAVGVEDAKLLNKLCKRLEPIKEAARKARDRASQLLDNLTATYAQEVESVEQLEAATNTLHERLGEAPAGVDGIYEQIALLEIGSDRVQAGCQGLQHNEDIAGSDEFLRAKAYALALCEAVPGRVAELTNMLESSPTTEKQVFHSKSMVVESAIRVLDKAIAQAVHESLTKARDALRTRHGNMLAKDRMIPILNLKDVMGKKKPDEGSKENIRAILVANQEDIGEGIANLALSYREMREEAIMLLVLECAFTQADVDSEHLKHQLHEAHIQLLNDQDWDVVTKDVVVQHDRLPVRLKSVITPASRLGNKYEAMNGKGVCCHDSKHADGAVNLALTELKDEAGTVIFSSFRHGIHSAYGIEDDGQRALANRNRALDVVTAALIRNEEKLAQALAGEAVTVEMNSISLVTPDAFRSGSSGEKKMLQEQMQAWGAIAAADAQPISISVRNGDGNLQDVNVNVRVNAFNFGVNEGGLTSSKRTKFLDTLSRGRVSGWEVSNSYNTPSMNALIGTVEERRASDIGLGGQVGEWLQAAGEADPAFEIVRDLGQQVARIWDTNAYQTQGVEPYKMVSRLALLSYKIGKDTAFNCKSGKDRTGQLDVEAKMLATQIKLKGSVPEPDSVLTENDKQNRYQMAVNSGNLEMQQLNTGNMGFKLEGVGALHESYGTGQKIQEFRGTSKFVSS